jgi:hypothetical protein
MLAEEEREAVVGSTLGVSRRWGARCHHGGDAHGGGSSGVPEVQAVVEISDLELNPRRRRRRGLDSLAFGTDGEGPYAGVLDGRAIRWLREERRWVNHSSAAAPQL